MKGKQLIIFVLGIFFIFPFVSGVTLDSTTVLNTTVSNSSMTFSITVTVSEITIEPTYIYLTDVSYVQGGVTKTCATLTHSQENTVLDSANFPCNGETIAIPPSGSSGVIYKPTEEQLKEGYTRILLKGWKVNINFNNEEYLAKVEDIFENEVKVSIVDNNYSIKINETKKINLDGDNYYDLEITVENIVGGRAQLTFKEIHEEIPVEEQEEQEEPSKIEDKGNWWLILLILVIVVIIFYIFFNHPKIKKRRKRRKH